MLTYPRLPTIIAKFPNKIYSVIALVIICIATLVTNLTTNIVSPANDFSNLYPKKISFKTGGYIAILLGIIIQPWRIVENPSGFIFRWLIAYSSFLAAIAGVLIAKYYVVYKKKLYIYSRA
jgi:NCS1 family nucleobase:cation symporter-1